MSRSLQVRVPDPQLLTIYCLVYIYAVVLPHKRKENNYACIVASVIKELQYLEQIFRIFTILATKPKVCGTYDHVYIQGVIKFANLNIHFCASRLWKWNIDIMSSRQELKTR